MKLTRKSYKRKIIAFGVAAFISLSLIATGFASWVLAGSTDKSDEGQISVGTTTEKAIGISDLSFTNDMKNFVFEPMKDDSTGRVRYDGENSENLSISFSCTITAASFVKELHVTFTMPAGVQAAVDAGYIVSPVVDIAINTSVSSTAQTAELLFSNGQSGGGEWTYTPNADDTSTLEVTLNFAWGDEFEGMNPSVYLDETEGRQLYPTKDDVKIVLDTLKATLLGTTYDEYITLGDSEIRALEAALKYTIYVNAEA